MESELRFIEVGCNRVAHAAAWGANDLVAYGAHNSVALWDVTAKRVFATLSGHKDRVNCVRWIPQDDGAPEVELISGSSDATLIVWRVSNGIWSQVATLKGHKESVTSMALLRVGDTTLLASSSIDATVHVWERPAGAIEFAPCDVVSFGEKMVECLALTRLPCGTVLLAAGGLDAKVHLLVRRADGKMAKISSLQGHEDWVRDVAFTHTDAGDILLASCSQDVYTRLWRISTTTEAEAAAPAENAVAAAARAIAMGSKGNKFRLSSGATYTITLDALLVGHEDWVYSVAWHPSVIKDGARHQPLCLVTASMDRTMMAWAPGADGVWTAVVRVGEMGGNTLGFYGAMFGPDGSRLLAHGYNGAFHLWQREGPADADSIGRAKWVPQVCVGGHFAPVLDMSWSPDDNFLVTVSQDQTARLFGPWVKEGREQSWHELGRPQIHGYDMSAVAFLPGSTYRMVSAADEKIPRVFDAPRSTLANLTSLAGASFAAESTARQPVGANVPALGLSNKAVFQGEISSEASMPSHDMQGSETNTVAFADVTLTEPPYEEHLLQNTLWPEIQKLYGHGYDIYCLAVNHAGTLVASACKAQSADHAVIRLWDPVSWKEVGQLRAGTLTVTQIEFSHDDKFVLSVSRDRSWTVHEVEYMDGKLTVVPRITYGKSHARIVWGCSWSPDDSLFATCARDSCVKVWRRAAPGANAEKDWPTTAKIDFADATTAVQFAPACGDGTSLTLAVGLENGAVYILRGALDGTGWNQLYTVPPLYSHCATVVRLRWRLSRRGWVSDQAALADARTRGALDLATASSDHSVRLFTVCLTA